jgi:hypothetical protein
MENALNAARLELRVVSHEAIYTLFLKKSVQKTLFKKILFKKILLKAFSYFVIKSLLLSEYTMYNVL